MQLTNINLQPGQNNLTCNIIFISPCITVEFPVHNLDVKMLTNQNTQNFIDNVENNNNDTLQLFATKISYSNGTFEFIQKVSIDCVKFKNSLKISNSKETVLNFLIGMIGSHFLEDHNMCTSFHFEIS